jgi:hypothetical protein
LGGNRLPFLFLSYFIFRGDLMDRLSLTKEEIDRLLDDDEISDAEAAFMEGYI